MHISNNFKMALRDKKMGSYKPKVTAATERFNLLVYLEKELSNLDIFEEYMMGIQKGVCMYQKVHVVIAHHPEIIAARNYKKGLEDLDWHIQAIIDKNALSLRTLLSKGKMSIEITDDFSETDFEKGKLLTSLGSQIVCSVEALKTISKAAEYRLDICRLIRPEPPHATSLVEHISNQALSFTKHPDKPDKAHSSKP